MLAKVFVHGVSWSMNLNKSETEVETVSETAEELVDIVTRLYRMVRPRGRDLGTQTDGEGMEDKATEIKWVFV